jgi:hypothetical protein
MLKYEGEAETEEKQLQITPLLFVDFLDQAVEMFSTFFFR